MPTQRPWPVSKAGARWAPDAPPSSGSNAGEPFPASEAPGGIGDPRTAGMIRSQIPRFRLPEEVIDEEVGYILDLGVELRAGERVDTISPDQVAKEPVLPPA